MLAAQYWGKKDPATIEKIMGIALRFSCGISAVFALGACGFPGLLMKIFTNDLGLIRIGSGYHLQVWCLEALLFYCPSR